jgi:hypothetical protein
VAQKSVKVSDQIAQPALHNHREQPPPEIV